MALSSYFQIAGLNWAAASTTMFILSSTFFELSSYAFAAAAVISSSICFQLRCMIYIQPSMIAVVEYGDV
jgi:hypothetical protein